jgi:hypothetical protein
MLLVAAACCCGDGVDGCGQLVRAGDAVDFARAASPKAALLGDFLEWLQAHFRGDA